LIVTLLLLVFLLKPDVSGVKISQIPEMLRKADQNLESNIEETLYWAQDRALRIYQDNPNVEKSANDGKNMRESRTLREAMREVEAATVGSSGISSLEERQQATQTMLQSHKQYLTLKIQELSRAAAENFLKNAPRQHVKHLYVVESGNHWKVSYGSFPTQAAFTADVLTDDSVVRNYCCDSYTPQSGDTIGKKIPIKQQDLFMSLNNLKNATEMKQGKPYLKLKESVSLCEFEKLKDC